AKNILKIILKTYIRDDDGYDKARMAFNIALSQQISAGYMAARYIGGHYIHRDQKSTTDARPPIVVVEAEKQRQALDAVVKYIFAKDAWDIDPELQQYLAASRWYHQGSSDWYNTLTYPIQERILSAQKVVLFRLLNTDTITNLYNSELRVAEGTDLFTLP